MVTLTCRVLPSQVKLSMKSTLAEVKGQSEVALSRRVEEHERRQGEREEAHRAALR